MGFTHLQRLSFQSVTAVNSAGFKMTAEHRASPNAGHASPKHVRDGRLQLRADICLIIKLFLN